MERNRSAGPSKIFVVLTLVAALILVPAVPAQQAGGRYVVQVGAYAGPRAAAPLAGELTRRGFPTLVVPGGDYHRVVVGPFATEAEASTALARLQRQGYQGYIRSDLPLPRPAEPPAPRPAPTPPPGGAPAPATQTPAAPAPQSAAARPYVVQVGAFDALQTAAPLAQALLRNGFPAVVVPGDDFQRVVVGPYASESEATAVLSGLQRQGFQGYVRGDLRVSTPEAAVARAEPPEAAPAPAPPVPAPAEPTPEPPAEPPQVAEATPPPAPVPAPEPAPVTPREVAVTPREVEAPPSPLVSPQPAQPEPAAAPPPAVAPTPEPAAPVSEPQQQGIATLFPPEPPPEPQPQRPRAGSSLRLLVLAGQDAINNIKQRTARDPVVQVVDENDRPVAGAAITFALPDRGASGTFANGARSVTMLTDAQGRATAVGLTPNAVEGDLPIQVSASYQGQTASTVILQSNIVAAGAGISAATIGIIGAVAAGVAVGAVLALGGGESSTPPPAGRPSGTATVNTGGVTIGAPSQ